MKGKPTTFINCDTNWQSFKIHAFSVSLKEPVVYLKTDVMSNCTYEGQTNI